MGLFTKIIKESKEEEEFETTLRKVDEDELLDMLKRGVVKFEYLKKDGKTVRLAIGTKDMGLVKIMPSGGDCPPKRYGYTVYYDLEVENWRVFKADRVLGVFGDVKSLADYKASLVTTD